METESTGTERGTERAEAFSDGVMAIAITLLILEVKVPHPPKMEPIDLLNELFRLWPSYFALALSFVMIGIYWANHHYVFKLFTKTDHGLNLLNLLFLFWITFLPFLLMSSAATRSTEPTRPQPPHSTRSDFCSRLCLGRSCGSMPATVGSWWTPSLNPASYGY